MKIDPFLAVVLFALLFMAWMLFQTVGLTHRALDLTNEAIDLLGTCRGEEEPTLEKLMEIGA
jgi:hypothetical protein